MPTPRHGKSTQFTIADNGAVVRDISASLNNVSFPRPIDTAETTAFGQTYKSYVVGLIGATFSLSGMFDLTVDGYLSGLLGFDTPVAFVYGPEGTTVTRRKYTGTCVATNYAITGGVAAIVGFQFDCQIVSAVTLGTY